MTKLRTHQETMEQVSGSRKYGLSALLLWDLSFQVPNRSIHVLNGEKKGCHHPETKLSFTLVFFFFLALLCKSVEYSG